MLSLTGGLRDFLAVEPADICNGFERLHVLLSERLDEYARCGEIFVFTHRRHAQQMALYFEGTGLWLMFSIFRKEKPEFWRQGRRDGPNGEAGKCSHLECWPPCIQCS